MPCARRQRHATSPGRRRRAASSALVALAPRPPPPLRSFSPLLPRFAPRPLLPPLHPTSFASPLASRFPGALVCMPRARASALLPPGAPRRGASRPRAARRRACFLLSRFLRCIALSRSRNELHPRRASPPAAELRAPKTREPTSRQVRSARVARRPRVVPAPRPMEALGTAQRWRVEREGGGGSWTTRTAREARRGRARPGAAVRGGRGRGSRARSASCGVEGAGPVAAVSRPRFPPTRVPYLSPLRHPPRPRPQRWTRSVVPAFSSAR